ncbi:MAG TPA: UrcA family protein [Gammaproteobacteria bacterium]|nr:UrcA family protein [Gammaproteobacteria bacterium]
MGNQGLRTTLFLAAVTASGGAWATTATSADPFAGVPKGTVVQYRESDLATSDGAKHLYLRLAEAASYVCDDTGEYELRQSFATCERTAIADAVSVLGGANLTTEFNRHFPNQPLGDRRLSRGPRSPIVVVAVG